MKKRIVKKRVEVPFLDAQERIGSFKEVRIGYTPKLAVEEACRCLQCADPPCVKACPVHVPIPQFVKLISEGKFLEAVSKIKEENLLPSISGRICPHEKQCEGACTLGRIGEPLAIGALESFAADYEAKHSNNFNISIPKPNGKNVAIVGSGPAGIACAGDLARIGYGVTILEALHSAGGVPLYGIPEFRLPSSIIERQIDYLKSLGVKVRSNFVVGRERNLYELLENFNAVFIASGAGKPYIPNIEGMDLNGIYLANEFLMRVSLMKANEFPNVDTPIAVGKRVVVVGGGNTAMDVARTAKRLKGVEEVFIMYRRSENEMPAMEEERNQTKDEGVMFKTLINPVRFLGKNGWVKSIECVRMELGDTDESGRRKPIPIEGSNFTVDADAVVISMGQGINNVAIDGVSEIKTGRYGEILVDENLMTGLRGVFAGGDVIRGTSTAIAAMRDGRKAARAIDRYLKDA